MSLMRVSVLELLTSIVSPYALRMTMAKWAMFMKPENEKSFQRLSDQGRREQVLYYRQARKRPSH
jgi:hypothetical protein